MDDDRNELVKRLVESKEFRDAFMAETVQKSVAAQVLALRKQHGLTAHEFALKVGVSYSTVSRLENPRANQFCRTDVLLKIASAFDVALIIKFVTFSRWLGEYFVVTPDGLQLCTPNRVPPSDEVIAEIETWSNAETVGT